MSVGLGREIEAGTKQVIGGYPSGLHLDHYEYNLSARILRKAQLRVRLSHVNLRHSDRPTEVIGIIQVLL